MPMNIQLLLTRVSASIKVQAIGRNYFPSNNKKYRNVLVCIPK